MSSMNLCVPRVDFLWCSWSGSSPVYLEQIYSRVPKVDLIVCTQSLSGSSLM